ncbi:hypothetical protein JTE90_020714 [Oedothorax gibbosus]|uniref:H15 domain-containing protein n=1 Tax=Oedothorax gibbosus TaxID=931172 RepID=A0AAV6V6B7_9ARAC|nr:hypothetical protein JTE90_020714 [Oedothorax gibbosus]
MSSPSNTEKLKEDVCLDYPEITSQDIFETITPLVSISDDESSIAFATEFKCDSPIPTKKAKVCRNLFGDDHQSVSSTFEETFLTHSYKPRNSTPVDPLKYSAFHSESLDNILSGTNQHDGQELDKTQVAINEDKCKKEKSSFQSKHFSLYVADPFTSDKPEKLKYPLSTSNILRGSIPKHPLDLPYFEQEDEKQTDANYFKCNIGENFKCTKTNSVEFPDLSSLDKSLNNETDNSSSSYTRVFESRVTDINDNLESIKEECDSDIINSNDLIDLDSINSDDLIDLDCNNIDEELSNILKDDFPCEERNGAPSTNLNNTLKNYRDLLPEINANIKSHSILLDLFKDWTKNQEDSSGVINKDESSENTNYKKLSNSSKIPNEVTDSLILDDSLLAKERISRTIFTESETKAYTPYTERQIALTKTSGDKINFDYDSCGDGLKIVSLNQPLFNERLIITETVSVSEENRSTDDRQCDEEKISYSNVGTKNVSCFDKSKFTYTEDSQFSTMPYLKNNCTTPSTPDIKFRIFEDETAYEENYLKVQNTNFESYKEKTDTKNEILNVVHSFFNEKNLFENNLFGNLYEIDPTSSKDIKAMEMTRDDDKLIQETSEVVKHSTLDFHQLLKNVPNNSETEEFRDISENPELFSLSSIPGKYTVLDCPNVVIEPLSDSCDLKYKSSSITETNSTLNFRKNFPKSDQISKETLRNELVPLNDIDETEESENCCHTNVKPFTEAQNSTMSNQNFFSTQVNIKDSTDKLKPPRKVTSNLLSTGIILPQLMKDLYDIDKNIAQSVLVSISKLDRKAGVKHSQILKYIQKNKIVRLNPKLHHEVSRFLTTTCEVGLVKDKASKYMLTDQVKAIAGEYKKGEQKMKLPRRIRGQQIDTIKKLSIPIHSPKLLSTKAHLKLGTPKFVSKVFKTLRSRVVYQQ